MELCAKKFREELNKIMPGYKWTVHKNRLPKDWPLEYLIATGTQSSGFNRLSTLSVDLRVRDGKKVYQVKSAGYGLRANWLATNSDETLARALRGLQNHYKHKADNYRCHEQALEKGRSQPKPECPQPNIQDQTNESP